MQWKRRFEILKGTFGRGVYPHEMGFSLTLPLRRLVLSPGTLADRLSLDESARVLELGPGPGYFSIEVARRVPVGGLELFDLQYGMLETAQRRLEAANAHHVGLTQGDGRWLPFADQTFDVVFTVAVLGEVPDPRACVREIHRVLRSGGTFSNTEQPGDPDFLPPNVVCEMAESAGFGFVEQFGNGKNYTVNFEKLT